MSVSEWETSVAEAQDGTAGCLGKDWNHDMLSYEWTRRTRANESKQKQKSKHCMTPSTESTQRSSIQRDGILEAIDQVMYMPG